MDDMSERTPPDIPADHGFAARAGRRLAELAAAGPGRVHIAAWDLADAEPVTVAADERVPSASTIKVPILAASLAEAAAGRLDLHTHHPLPTGRTGGTGVLDSLRDLRALSLADLLTLMIVVSDNAATNRVIDAVGIDAVNAFCERAGLTSTRLERRLMDVEAKSRGLENLTSARDQALLLYGLAHGTLLPAEQAAFALEFLAGQQTRDRLPALLPDGARIAHKTGELRGLRHDTGIITTPAGRQAAVAALVTGLSTEPREAAGPVAACRTIAEIGLTTYLALRPDLPE